MMEREIQAICARLYYGWVEKADVPRMAQDPALYAAVQDRLAALGLELINRPESPWYVVRLFREHDSFAQFHKRNRSLQGPHLALLLILYTKLLLPRRTGQVSLETDLSVTFQELYEGYGYKFVPRRRKTASESTLKTLLATLSRLGFVIKKRGTEMYQAGPAMYMLHEELLADMSEAALRALFGLDEPALSEVAAARLDEEEDSSGEAID